MWHLKAKYPACFWAAPEEFFTDGALVNRGADFGLMPSAFEPGGIVQHEFFVGGTPVVAFKTGGLKDSVVEYMWDSETGSGYTFECHSARHDRRHGAGCRYVQKQAEVPQAQRERLQGHDG